MRLLASLVWILCLAAPAAGLTVDQVVALKKAGVGEKTIQSMIRTEMEVRARGGVGTYAVEGADGGMVVYRAASPGGVVDYPWPDTRGRGGRLQQAARAVGADLPPAQRPGRGGEGAYTLHLSSFRDPDRARRAATELRSRGVDARVAAVDLGAKGRWHRVLVGQFPKRRTAQQKGSQLKKAGSIGSFRVIPR
jgi:hypothetical protein